MSERKSTNKYYPPDYDPVKAEREARKLSKRLKTMNKDTITIRLMTPFSMRCLKCNEFIPKSRKFNAKKESLPEKYLDKIRIYRFEIRCPSCNNVISFKTNPRTGDYTMDFGGVKNFSASSESEKQSSVPENETLEQTLERLEKEQEREQLEANAGPGERQAGSLDDEGKDRIELIEERLAKLQKEQEDDLALEELALQEQQKHGKLDELHEARKRMQEDQEVLDEMIADQAFEEVEQQQQQTEAKVQTESSELDPDQRPKPILEAIVPKKLSLKRKKNPLGVKLKKKKTV